MFQRNHFRLQQLVTLPAALLLAVSQAGAAPQYAPDVPAKITTPNTVETRLGTLHFTNGTPDAATVQLAYDQLDFSRGIEAFTRGISATSVHAMCKGFEEAGIKLNRGIGISEDLLDARSLFLTANTTTVYAMLCVDVSKEPMVLRVPPRVLGPVDDADFRWVTDVGLTGPDKGAGGDYLDGSRTYSVTLPGPIPANNFWAFTAYDNQTRSLLPTDQKTAGIDSTIEGIKLNPDGGVTVWFGPEAPVGHEANWVQTWPGQGYNAALRLYGPLQPWFDRSWRPGDLRARD
jgi:hypothetical protein